MPATPALARKTPRRTRRRRSRTPRRPPRWHTPPGTACTPRHRAWSSSSQRRTPRMCHHQRTQSQGGIAPAVRSRPRSQTRPDRGPPRRTAHCRRSKIPAHNCNSRAPRRCRGRRARGRRARSRASCWTHARSSIQAGWCRPWVAIAHRRSRSPPGRGCRYLRTRRIRWTCLRYSRSQDCRRRPRAVPRRRAGTPTPPHRRRTTRSSRCRPASSTTRTRIQLNTCTGSAAPGPPRKRRRGHTPRCYRTRRCHRSSRSRATSMRSRYCMCMWMVALSRRGRQCRGRRARSCRSHRHPAHTPRTC
jgi:hypothetical protein